jgi:hypothetical protein
MTPDDRWFDRARFDAEHAKRVWAGSADTEDAPAWYGRVATLIRDAATPATEDELAGESDIVARMQAAILEPAPDEELGREPDIVARMQTTILDLRTSIEGDDAGDADRPRHLRAAVGGHGGARRRGARVVGRIVAAKAAAVTTVVAIGVTAAAATTGIVATVVVPALSSHEPTDPKPPKPQPAADYGSTYPSAGVDDGDWGDTPSETVITLVSGQRLSCMFQLDCLITQVEKAASTTSLEADSPGADDATSTDGTVVDPNTATTSPPPETTTTTASEPPAEPAPTTTTTTAPPTTTTTTAPPTTTTTTAPTPTQSAEVAAASAEPTSTQTGDSGGTTAATAAGLTAGTEPKPAS